MTAFWWLSAEDLVFDGDLGGVGELVAVGAEELDAVVLPGIVRGRDDDAGGEFVRAGEEGDGGGGDDAGALDGGSAGGEAGGEGGGDPEPDSRVSMPSRTRGDVWRSE